MASPTSSGYAAINQDNRVLYDSGDRSNNETWWFDGKIGTYPLVEEKIQQRRSVHHNRGNKILVNFSMTAQVYEKIILYQLFTDILTICPPEMRNKTIYIQKDNASPHRITKEKVDRRCRELGISVVMFYPPTAITRLQYL
jgi:hypothetical protein